MKPIQPDPAAPRLYQLKITLQDIEPPIWRRIQVEECTLARLHGHIQAAMGWEDSHLYQFEIGGAFYGEPELLDQGFGAGPKVLDAGKIKLGKVAAAPGAEAGFLYVYDFGDDWRHEVLCEGSVPAAAGVRYPRCLEGERACPPEDVGGPPGFQHYLEVLASPGHEEHEDLLEWGGPFDPETFTVEEATRRMRSGPPR